MVIEAKDRQGVGNNGIDTPATVGRPDDEARRRDIATFWFSLIKASEESQPRNEWALARKRYEEEPNTPRMFNLWRPKIETQAAFIDNEPPVVRFDVPTVCNDEMSQARAKLSNAVYTYIDREQGVHEQMQKMRHSADVTNVGFAAVVPDRFRNMPEVVYLKPEQIVIDPSCGGNLKIAGFVGWHEFASPEELAASYPDVPLSTFHEAANERGYAVTELKEEGGANTDERGKALKRCKFYRVFARGSYALYDKEPEINNEEEAMRPKGFHEREGLVESRRFLVFVEGIDVPVVDLPAWPREMLLDKGETPITRLAYNECEDNPWGFTDYRHERNLLEEIDRLVTDFSVRKSIEGLKLGGDGSSKLTKEQIKEFLETKGVAYQSGWYGTNGESHVKPVEIEAVGADDVAYLQFLINLYDQIAMQPKVTRGNEDKDKSATATQIETDLATARANHRLRLYEAAMAEVARKIIQMAHVMLPPVTEIEREVSEEVIDETSGMVQVVPSKTIVSVDWQAAQAELASGISELVSIGIDAIAGAEYAQAWIYIPADSQNKGLEELILRGVRVGVERGSTQRHQRIQDVTEFKTLLADVIQPLAMQLAKPSVIVKAVEKILTKLGLDEFDSIVTELNTAIQEAEAAQAQMQQQQQMIAEQQGVANAGI